MGHRPVRVAELVHKEVAQRLRLDIKDDRIGDVSITHVKMSPDLSYARIEYMPLGGGQPTDAMREGMADAAKRLRGPIGRALKLRHAPELRFVPDEHTDAAVNMTRLLENIAAERGDRDEPSTDDDSVDGAEE